MTHHATGFRLRTAAMAAMAVLAASPAAAETKKDPLSEHARTVATVVFDQYAETPDAEDRERLDLVRALVEERTAVRLDMAVRAIHPLGRRQAVMRALNRNLTLTIARGDPDSAHALLEEAEAVFDPLFDVQVGYTRQDSYRRTRFGTVIPRLFTPQGNEFVSFPPNTPAENFYCSLRCRMNIQKFADRNPVPGNPTVMAFEFYENRLSFPINTDIIGNSGRTNSSPKEPWNFTVTVEQKQPWGGTLTLADRSIMQEVYYRGGHYWEDGQWTSNISAALDSPAPFAKGFGRSGADNTRLKQARIGAEQADWRLKATTNEVLLQTDGAYFDLVRRLDALYAAAQTRDLVSQLHARMTRLYERAFVTRYQMAQLDAETAKADLRVEQALDAYVTASIRLGGLLGDSETEHGAVLFLPIDFRDALAREIEAPTLEQAFATAKRARPDLLIQDLGRDSAALALENAKNEARPDIRLSATIASNQDGSNFGYATPLDSHAAVGNPDRFNHSQGITFTYPWGNRAAESRLISSRMSMERQTLAVRATENTVRRELAQGLAQVQAARAALIQRTLQAEALRTAYESLERRLEAGMAGQDELLTTLRGYLSAETARIDAAAARRRAEMSLLYAQGAIASALAADAADSGAERRRLEHLAGTGVLAAFAPLPDRDATRK